MTYPPWTTPLANTFLDAGKELGFPIVDYNGPTQTGFSILQTTLRNGTRVSLSRAFLHPISDRKNLHVRKNAMVTKIVIDPKTLQATAVEFLHRGQRYLVEATKEVIVSAGAINSPQLLMLSGIGPKGHLQKMGIPVLKNLKVSFGKILEKKSQAAVESKTLCTDFPTNGRFKPNKLLVEFCRHLGTVHAHQIKLRGIEKPFFYFSSHYHSKNILICSAFGLKDVCKK